MNFILVTCVFPPEPVVSAATSYQIAKELCARGNQVHVITSFPNRPAGKLYKGYFRRLFTHEISEDGFDILRCFSFFSPRSTMGGRLLENVSFGITSAVALLKNHRPDVVYGNTWPLFAQGCIWLVCKLRGIPLVLSIQDIYPESLQAQKRLKYSGSFIFKALRRMDEFIARHSQAIIVISENFRQFYIGDRKLPAEKIHTISNWGSETKTAGEEIKNNIRRDHNIPEDGFLVVYGGNIGIAAGVDDLIRAFQDLINYRNIYLMIAGDGSMAEHCRWLASKGSNPRIVFHQPWKLSETTKVLQAADLLILPTQGEQSMVSVPSKLISYMFSARPVLALAQQDSEIANTILDSDSGWVVQPGNQQELSRQILEISTFNKSELGRRGEAGGNFARRYYSKSANLPKVIDVLESAARKVRHDPIHATC